MTVNTAVDIGKVLQPVQAGLRLVEEKMRTLETSLFAPLASAFIDLIGSGGKRLRPALALMAAEVTGGLHPTADYPRVVSLAASVEMLHTATLVHDDVIDGALLRRGAPTLNAIWNRGATVLAGNYLFARAAALAAETDNTRVIQIFSNTLEIIVDGELHQLFARNNYHQDKEEYYQRIYAKTASLFCAATEAAAVLAGSPAPVVEQLKQYGYNLGMAFQIVDDILDFTGDADSLGKPAGSDLRQGTLTLPFFHFIQQHPQPDQVVARMDDAYRQAEDGDESTLHRIVAEIVAELRASSAIEAARGEAITFLDRARANLAHLPDNEYKVSMLDLCDFVVQRTY
ncbi:polyprenyl synthetase family protein [Litorilinea aerophila]|nr:polyprenyl synthetase family protein [Litorilinea aerophila]MCC9079033.1 polyprenyl synthetase family protein [Litorilinea aerophila]GIV75939.1 MAG: solanesyl diphosphate synthase [Litorilinea sp.]